MALAQPVQQVGKILVGPVIDLGELFGFVVDAGIKGNVGRHPGDRAPGDPGQQLDAQQGVGEGALAGAAFAQQGDLVAVRLQLAPRLHKIPGGLLLRGAHLWQGRDSLLQQFFGACHPLRLILPSLVILFPDRRREPRIMCLPLAEGNLL